MSDLMRRSWVSKPKADNSGLFRSFEHGWIKGYVPSSIVYSRDLAEFLKNGIELTTREVDGRDHVSIWHLQCAMVDANGKVTEFLLVQDASEEVQFTKDGPSIWICGSYFVRFERSGGWTVRRRCVYFWQDSDDETLELNHVGYVRKLPSGNDFRYIEHEIYRQFDW